MSAPYTATLSRFLLHLATSYVIMPMALHERQAVGYILREEVVDMPITITLHILGYVVTIRIKSENRHSAK